MTQQRREKIRRMGEIKGGDHTPTSTTFLRPPKGVFPLVSHLDMAGHKTFADMLDNRDYERTKVPKTIGQYRLGKTIGSGAFCKVKAATHMVTKEKFAIKILQPQAPQNWAEVEREIEILRQIQHPNVLWAENKGGIHKLSEQFAEVKVQAVKIYIVVELAQGGELWQLIASNGPMNEDAARRLFRQMICHRDLKLENILLDTENNVKINDFGLSNFMRPGHSMHTFCGTLSYAAPEILSQQAYVGFFVDIWSLGIILFAMLTGDVPWALDDEQCRSVELSNLLSGKFRLPYGVVLSRECLSLLQIMLQPNPKNRSSLAQIRMHPWTNKGFDEPPARIFENYPTVTEIDESIIQQISLLGLSPTKALLRYYTLLKKQMSTKTILPPLVRHPGETTSVPRFATLSVVSSAPPAPLKHPDISDDSEDLSRKLEYSLRDELPEPHSPPSKNHFSQKAKLVSISAPNSPTNSSPLSPSPRSPGSPPSNSPHSPQSPCSPVSPQSPLVPPLTPLAPITPSGPPPAGVTLFNITSPRNTMDAPPRKKLPGLSDKVHLDPITPTSPTHLSPISSPSHLKRLSVSGKLQVSPLSPKAPKSPKSPKSPLAVSKEGPFGISAGGWTMKEVEGSVTEGEEKKKPIFQSLISKLRGSKLAPLEV